MAKQSSIAFVAFLLLSGCGESYSTPLSHALVALRAGDGKEMRLAKDEADAEVKRAIQPGQDLCAMNAADIARYNAQYVIDKLNQPEILQLPEEERLLFALKYASERSHIWQGSFLENAPLVKSVTTGARNECDRDKQMASMMAAGSTMLEDDAARFTALNSWMDSLKKKHGDKLDDTMRSAAAHLQSVGYSSTWPANIQDRSETNGSFSDIQDQLKKH